MADLLANKPQFVIVGTTADFASLLLDAAKISRIYEEPQIAGETFKSFNPLGGINSLTSFTTGRGYLIFPKVNVTIPSLSGNSEAVFSNSLFQV